MNIHYAGTPGDGFGWGTCNTHLIRELGLLRENGLPCSLTGLEKADAVFIPLANHDFDPASPARAKVNMAYTFFESPLGPNAAVNAAKYDVVFCGSTWCLDRMRERGITNGEVLIQGVDREVFHTDNEREADGQIRIFSGGKFEYRKGQDLVIAAFRDFADEHDNAHLVCSWFNPWPQLISTMIHSPHLRNPARPWTTQNEYFAALLEGNGLHPSQFTILPKLNHFALAREMANTDIGLFPNRCEGGTNLVLMEYAACGGRVIANGRTGHADVRNLLAWEISCGEDENKWADQTVLEIEDALFFGQFTSAPTRPRIPKWDDAARQILFRAQSLLKKGV